MTDDTNIFDIYSVSAMETSIKDLIDKGINPGTLIDKFREKYKSRKGKYILYHATTDGNYKNNPDPNNEDDKYLMPDCIDYGNAFNDIGWSLFVSPSHDFAERWVCYRALQGVLHYERTDGKPNFGELCWNPYRGTFMTCRSAINAIIPKVEAGKLQGYIYTIEATPDMVHFANDSCHPEVTIRTDEPIKFTKKELVTVSMDMLEKWAIIFDTRKEFVDATANVKIDPFLMGNGPLSFFVVRDYRWNEAYNTKTVKALSKAVHDGDLTPPKDIKAYMKKHNLKLMTVPPIQRAKRYLGL